MQAGDKVRVIDNPSRVGTLSSDPPIGEGRRRRLIVDFPDGTEPVLAASLEKVVRETRDAYLLMQRGEYGRTLDLRGAITHYRLSGKLANLIYSMNTTNTQFLPYQFKPVLQYLDSPSRGLVIADEVGLGKTIEAGLIWTELRARLDARRLLVLCPAMLREKWRDELLNRFGVKAEIVDAAGLLERLEAARDRSQEEFAVIASMQGLRPLRDWNADNDPSPRPSARLARFLAEAASDTESLLHLVIIDEAHYLRNADTLTNLVGRLLRPVSDGLAMLSATPIQMKSTDLFNLLHLLDADAFPHEWTYDRSVAANAPIVRLRDRVLREVVTPQEFVEELDKALALRVLDDSAQLQFLRQNLPDAAMLATSKGRSLLAEQLNRINPRANVISRTLKRDVQELRVQRLPVTIKASLSHAERAFYDLVTEAVRGYCEDAEVPEGFMVTIPQRQMSSCMAAACRGWRQRLVAHATPDLDDEELYELDGDDAKGDAARTGAPTSGSSSSGELLQLLVGIATEVGDYQTLRDGDSKLEVLIRSLKTYWRAYPGRKVVLFAFYKNTLHYLRERLVEEGVDAIVLHGGMDKQAAGVRVGEWPNNPAVVGSCVGGC